MSAREQGQTQRSDALSPADTQESCAPDTENGGRSPRSIALDAVVAELMNVPQSYTVEGVALDVLMIAERHGWAFIPPGTPRRCEAVRVYENHLRCSLEADHDGPHIHHASYKSNGRTVPWFSA